MPLTPESLLFMQQAAQMGPDQAQMAQQAQQPNAMGLNAYLARPVDQSPQQQAPAAPAQHMMQDAKPAKRQVASMPQQPAAAAMPQQGADASPDPYGYKAALADLKQKSDSMGGLKDYISALSAQSPGVSFGPIAAAIEQTNHGNGSLSRAVAANDPMSPDDKQKMLLGLQMGLAKDQLGGSQDVLKGIQAQMSNDMQTQKLAAMMQHYSNQDANGAARAQNMGAQNPRGMAMLQGAIDRTAGVYDKDPILNAAVKQRNQIGLDTHTLNSPDTVINSAVRNEISTGIANALAGGKAASLEATKMQQINSLSNDWSDLQAKIADKPVAALSPENRAQLQSILSRLDSGYSNVVAARAQQIHDGRHFVIPEAQQTSEDKLKMYQQSAQMPTYATPAAATAHPQDSAAMAWAKANPNDPRAAAILKANGAQ